MLLAFKNRYLTWDESTAITFHIGELGDGNYIIFSKYTFKRAQVQPKSCSETELVMKNHELTRPGGKRGATNGLETLITEYKANPKRDPKSAWIKYLHCVNCRNLLGLYISPKETPDNNIFKDIKECHEIYRDCQLKSLKECQFSIEKYAATPKKSTLRRTRKATLTGEYTASRPSSDGLYHHSSATPVRFSDNK